MNPTSDRKVLLVIFLVSVAVRGLTAVFVAQPGFTDVFYYVGIARNLYEGRGFVEDLIWNYLDQPPSVTHPSNTYWGPLASLIVLPSFWIFGPSFRAAQAPMVLLSALLPTISYATARHLSASRRQALLAAGLTLFSGMYFVYWTVPDGAVPFAIAASLALLLASKSLSAGWGYAGLAGVAAGLAQLARSDGVLLLLVLLGLSALRIVMGADPMAPPGQRVRRRSLVLGPLAILCGYAIVMAPWFYRNWIDLGSPFFNPGLKTMFLREYDDVFAYGHAVDLSRYLSWGLRAIVTSKLKAGLDNLHILAKLLSYFLLPLAIVGATRFFRDWRTATFFAYGAALYAAMTFLFTFPGPLGAYLHSVVALLPFLATLTSFGVDRAVNALVTIRSNLQPSYALRLGTGAVFAGQVVLTLGLSSIAVREWDQRYSYPLYPQAVEWLAPRLSPNEPVVILDPPAYNYYSGRPAIVIPNNETGTLFEAARRYGARYVLLEQAHTKPMDKLFRSQDLPPGLSLRLALKNERGRELKVYELE